ncbi:hypothetical protein EOL96_00915 [Candidatus Saccharibacteria bacterium]|nr:hypothetical protein [Candidatus Saccharibacteria bacterium]
MFGGDIWLSGFLLLNIFVVGVVSAIAFMHARAHYKNDEPRRTQKTFPILPHDVRQRIIEEAEGDYEKVLRKNAAMFGKDLASTATHLSEQLNKIGNEIMDDELQRYRTELDQLRKETQQAAGSASVEIAKHQEDLRSKLETRQSEVEARLSEAQAELEAKFAARTTELEESFKQKQIEYANKQISLEAELANHQAQLSASLKERETKLATHQAELEEQLTTLQAQHAKKQAELEAKLEQDMEQARQRAAAQLETKIGDSIAGFLTDTLGHNVDLGAQTAYLTAMLEEHKEELLQEVKSGN